MNPTPGLNPLPMNYAALGVDRACQAQVLGQKLLLGLSTRRRLRLTPAANAAEPATALAALEVAVLECPDAVPLRINARTLAMTIHAYHLLDWK